MTSRIDIIGQNGNDGLHYEEDLITRLKKRAEIRRQIQTRKSVQENAPDRISDLLEEAANEIKTLRRTINILKSDNTHLRQALQGKEIG